MQVYASTTTCSYITTAVVLCMWKMLGMEEFLIDFSDFPREMFQYILQFLSYYDLARMDMAVLNHKLRRFYLAAVDCLMIPVYFPTPRRSRDPLNWLLLRNIRVCEFRIERDELPELALLQQSLSVINSIGLITPIAFPIINFPKLTSLSYYSNVYCPNLLKQNPQLEKLIITSCPLPQSIQGIVLACPNLTYLDVSSNHWIYDSSISLFLLGNLNLSFFNISRTHVQEDQSISSILNSFSKIRCLIFNGCPISANLKRDCIKRLVYPALTSENLSTKMLGLRCLHLNSFGVGGQLSL